MDLKKISFYQSMVKTSWQRFLLGIFPDMIPKRRFLLFTIQFLCLQSANMWHCDPIREIFFLTSVCQWLSLSVYCGGIFKVVGNHRGTLVVVNWCKKKLCTNALFSWFQRWKKNVALNLATGASKSVTSSSNRYPGQWNAVVSLKAIRDFY